MTASVCVIVPVYNASASLASCLNALSSSDYAGRWSAVLVDDGSTDASPSISDEWARRNNARVIATPKPRSGPALARNLGATHTDADVLFFVDSDVQVRPETIGHIVEFFDRRPEIAALFGSYDDAPSDPSFPSQAKNLFHHYTHQNGREDAVTFWSGCGAIRASAFAAVAGFDAVRYPRPSIEDIELGFRLRKAGFRIWLDKGLLVKHLKSWKWGAWIKSDLLDRGIPWTRLLLDTKDFHDDLNLQTHNRLSVLIVGLMWIFGVLGIFATPLLPLLLPMGAALVALNWKLYRWFADKRGWWFALRAIPWHWIYYTINILCAIGGGWQWLRSSRPAARPATKSQRNVEAESQQA